MSAIIEHLTDLDSPEARIFCSLTDNELRRGNSSLGELFIAESPKVIHVALNAGMKPMAMLCEQKHIEGDARSIIERPEAAGMRVLTGSRELLQRLTGYKLTRGVLCAMRRPEARTAAEVCEGASRVAVLDSVVDSTNVGAIFRSAAALGIDAVLLSGSSCDALNRRVVRVSMGSVFLVPWAWVASPQQLGELGFRTVAMALRRDSIELDSEILAQEPRLAIILGTEGDGLADNVIDGADYTVRIPMSHNVDSLNVAAASAVAFWQLCRQKIKIK